MHIADGVLSLPLVGATALAAGGVMVYSLRGATPEEIPKLSLLSGAFFVFSMISIPVGPTTVHPLLGGLLGIMLTRHAPIAIFIGLLLQALLFQHGGITTLGVNLLLVAMPALVAGTLFYRVTRLSVFVRAALAGGFAVIGCVAFVVFVLWLSDPVFSDGTFSVVNILILGYTPLVIVEALLTGFAVNYLFRVRPEMLRITKSCG